MQALILAGGFGSRLMPLVNDRPKVMAPVSGRPFLEILIRNLKKQGFDDIVLALGYLSKYIIDYFQDGNKLGIKIRYSIEDMPLGTVGAIKNAQPLLESTFCTINGDTYLNINFKELFEFFRTHQARLVITLTRFHHLQERGVVKVDKNMRAVSFSEISENRSEDKSYTNTGVYLIDKNILNWIKKDEKISLEKEVFPLLLREKIPIYCYLSKKDYLDIGTPERYLKAQKILKIS